MSVSMGYSTAMPRSFYWPCAEHVKVGDVLDTSGGRIVVAHVEPYVHPEVTKGERWALVTDETGAGVTLDRGLHACCKAVTA